VVGAGGLAADDERVAEGDLAGQAFSLDDPAHGVGQDLGSG
jgi:hypothetical protein